MSHRFNTFGSYVKKTFGTLVQKVNIDAGFTCPNRDGTLSEGGCVFCNNDSFKPGECRPALSVNKQVQNGISYLKRRYGAQKFIAYFQAYTNTYAPVGDLERIYREALSESSVVGIAVGTRPDCIDTEKLDLLVDIAKDKFVLVEYGLQSIYEKSLRYINRGHDYDTFLKAVEETHARGLHTGVHTIVGIPTETREETLEMADELSGTPVEFIKIHQLQVIKDTPLAETFKHEPFHVFEYEEYLDFVVDFIERLRPDLVLQRLFATAPDEILIAPQWGRTRHEILRDIERRFVERNTWQGRRLRRYTKVH
jgi:radical SAM protein (TIGR01212 family)